MDKIASKEQLFRFISEVRNVSDHFTTNFFWDEEKHQQWISDGSLGLFRYADNCLLLLHNENGFSFLFYVAKNLTSLSNAIKNCQFKETVVADIVTKGAKPKEIALFKENDYKIRRKLFRMVRIGAYPSKEQDKDTNIRRATYKDISQIREMLLASFDKLSEQIPSDAELGHLIDKKGVHLYVLGNEIAGLIISQTIGQTWYLRYWLVNPKYRGRGVGSSLFHYVLSKNRVCIRQILWVAEDNDRAIAKYEHYGFKKDGLNDYVLIKENDI